MIKQPFHSRRIHSLPAYWRGLLYRQRHALGSKSATQVKRTITRPFCSPEPGRGPASPGLRREIHALNPDGDSHALNPVIRQYGGVAGIASGPRHELEALKEKLTKALDASIDPVVRQHEDLKSTVWQLGHDRAWDESPVGRGGVRA